MMINRNYLNVGETYLFTEIGRRVAAFSAQNPKSDVIRLGIGDVTLPLSSAAVAAMKKAAAEMGEKETFRGYGPEQGYDFLRNAVSGYYKSYGTDVAPDEVYISDGAKSDLGNVLDIFDATGVLIPDPVYPVYADTNVMAGREIEYLDANAQNGFLPLPGGTAKKQRIIYLCSPNNPTGAAYTRDGLAEWVRYANETGSIILFDAAYESFVSSPEIPHSIYEIDGARDCAIEFCSLSKTAGFTGVRCGYTVVPKGLERDGVALSKLWLRRQTTKFNGVSYITQRGAEAIFTPAGLAEVREATAYYKENAKTISNALKTLGIEHYGGENSPYIWMRCPGGMGSWEYFDYLLKNKNIVGTPGEGFGKNGHGYFRLTGFGDRERTKEAARRLLS
ncbi:MAG: LL-diaminopimelate aminotransferase [Clostridia bacterium]|nr:LL-diaminopimelate aminotransferase [Clostridia bacterium]